MQQWRVKDVVIFATDVLSLKQAKLLEKAKVDGKTLLSATEQNLFEWGIPQLVFKGAFRKLMDALEALAKGMLAST